MKRINGGSVVRQVNRISLWKKELKLLSVLFDIPGLFVWHCHIVEHEDNEMMRPLIVQRRR